MIIDWRRKVAEHSHRPFDAEFPVGDTFGFGLSFSLQGRNRSLLGKSSKMRGFVFGAEAIKQSSKSV
jgi:hypothetical protein